MRVCVVHLTGEKASGGKYQWQLGDEFFGSLEGAEVRHGSVEVQATVVARNEESYDVDLRLRGEVEVECNHCTELLMFPIEGEASIRIALGQPQEWDGETLWVSPRESEAAIDWQVYETIALSIPIRHVHEQCETED